VKSRWLNQGMCIMAEPNKDRPSTLNYSGTARVDMSIGEHAAVTADDGPCFMGADPAAVIHYVVGKRLPEGRHQYLAVGHATSWEELRHVAALLNVRCVVIDAAYDPTKAREFVASFPGRAWLAYYPTQPIKGAEPVRTNRGEHRVDLGRTDTLDMSAARLLEQRDILPRCDYATHL
jgi:hypothetical protein